MRLHPEVVLIALSSLMHFRVTLLPSLFVVELGAWIRVASMGALTQQQSAISQVIVDDNQNLCCQLMVFQQPAEVENGGFVRNTIQVTGARSWFPVALPPWPDHFGHV